jgi:folate-dependent phosphoribosylglycinamide formyltransferase PurN
MPGIVVLTCPTPHAWIVINALVAHFGPVTVLTEEREARGELIRRRMRRRGVIPVLGQIAFVMYQKLVEDRAKPRIDEIIREEALDPNPNAALTVMPVRSVNSTACRAALAMLKPDIVLVIGTRIIGRQTLAALDAPIINYHAGINPKYRGQAGGYWALAMGDRENAGVTLHLIDQGVDTGAILYQARFVPTPSDSFPTYFYLQAAIAREPAVKTVEGALSGRIETQKVDLPTRQFYHPTLWFYLWTAWRKGVW